MLAKMFKMMKKGNKGFTLVELMVVVVIIGVLTAIAVPVYNNVTAKAKINAIAANLRIINGAISQYMTDTGTALTATDTVNDDLVPDYIQTSPNGNPKGVNYKFGLGATDGVEDAAGTTGTIQGIANVTAEISGGGFTLEAGFYDLADVQAVINSDVDEEEDD